MIANNISKRQNSAPHWVGISLTIVPILENVTNYSEPIWKERFEIESAFVSALDHLK